MTIVPYNPKTKDIFKIIKTDLQKILGNVRILHRGSTNLKISGQGEIDLYIPITRKRFNTYVNKLTNHLGEPGSVYALKRARFVKYVDDIKIEIFVINKNDSGWKESIQFERYLKNNPKALQEYEILKLKADGSSLREYYTAKTMFINKVINRLNSNG